MSSKSVFGVLGLVGGVTGSFFALIPVVEIQSMSEDKVIKKDFARPQFTFMSNKELNKFFDENILGLKAYIDEEYVTEDSCTDVRFWTRCYKWHLGMRHDQYKCIRKV